MSTDSGLLAPVRAATPVEHAVADLAWLQAMLDVEAGLARAQARLGVIPVDAAETITALARAEHLDLLALARRSRTAANPVVAFVADFTAVVADADEDTAEYVHYGSTSQDIWDTATVLVSRRAGALILADLDRAAAALARLAKRHRDTPAVARTLAQHAVPTTFGLRAANWLCAVLAARDQLAAALAELPVQLGGAAGTLAGYLERGSGERGSGERGPGERGPGDSGSRDGSGASPGALLATVAAELDLAEPVLPWHTDRTPLVRLGTALSLVTGALGKLALDVQLLSRTEVAEVAEPGGEGHGASSAMPHKRNPVLATMVRAASIQVPPLAATLASCMVAEDERPAGAWHAEWQPLRECLRLAGGAASTAAELVEGLIVNTAQMRTNLDITGAAVTSERVAAALAPRLGRAEAKKRAANPPADLPAGLTDPTRYTGAAAALVDRALAHYEKAGTGARFDGRRTVPDLA
jgi:3-carboxy-cis,cis-muconate cycloisomerase